MEEGEVMRGMGVEVGVNACAVLVAELSAGMSEVGRAEERGHPSFRQN